MVLKSSKNWNLDLKIIEIDSIPTWIIDKF